MFRINDVYKLHDTSFRILKMTLYHIVWIDIDSQSANPFLIEKNELTKSIEANEAEWIEDPFADIALLKVVEGSIQQQKRDAGMALIKPLITHDQFFDPSIRFDLVKRILEQQKSTHQTIYRLARRYWQRGQIPNALIPSFSADPRVKFVTNYIFGSSYSLQLICMRLMLMLNNIINIQPVIFRKNNIMMRFIVYSVDSQIKHEG